MIELSDLQALAIGARNVKRNPVKTQFTKDERRIVKHFFNSQHNRDLSSKRMRSFLALCDLLGEPLDASSSHRLEDADIVGDLHFLVGGDTVKSGNDWQLKCLGLAEDSPGVFVVGLNKIFYSNVTMKDLLPAD